MFFARTREIKFWTRNHIRKCRIIELHNRIIYYKHYFRIEKINL